MQDSRGYEPSPCVCTSTGQRDLLLHICSVQCVVTTSHRANKHVKQSQYIQATGVFVFSHLNLNSQGWVGLVATILDSEELYRSEFKF